MLAQRGRIHAVAAAMSPIRGIVVIGAGFYNFLIPSQLKAQVDRIAVRGKTFTYGENRPLGLAVIIALACGNV
jgi:FMN-dependent NADH-azoreductase